MAQISLNQWLKKIKNNLLSYISVPILMLAALVVSSVAMPVFVFAVINPGTWINDILTHLLDIVVWPIFAAASVLIFIWAGFLFLTAQGEPSKIAAARKAFLWASIGIAVAIVGFSATNIISSILGV